MAITPPKITSPGPRSATPGEMADGERDDVFASPADIGDSPAVGDGLGAASDAEAVAGEVDDKALVPANIEAIIPVIAEGFPEAMEGVKGKIALAADLLGAVADDNEDLPSQAVTAPAFLAAFSVLGESAARSLIPNSSAYALRAFGDSQTYGSNAANSAPYTDGAGRLLAAYRWPDIVASFMDSSLSVSGTNYAVGGQRLGWNTGFEYSYFNQLGNLPKNWTGVSVAMCGWNSVNSFSTSDDFYRLVRRQHEANIARMLLDGWFGISHLGWSSEGTGADADWDTDAVSSEQNTVATNKVSFNPFSYGDVTGGRWRIALNALSYVKKTLTGKRAVALFVETHPTGGRFIVKVNGVQVGPTHYSVWTSAYNDDIHQQVVFIDNLPSTAVVRLESIESAGGLPVYWLGGGYVNANPDAIARRTIIYGTTTGNTANQHDAATLYACAKQAEAAVGTFAEFGVQFANPFNAWVEATDQETGGTPPDISHLTDIGNLRVARAFLHATRVPLQSSPNYTRIGELPMEALQNALASGAAIPAEAALMWGTAGGFGVGSYYNAAADAFRFYNANNGDTLLELKRLGGHGAFASGGGIVGLRPRLVPSTAPSAPATGEYVLYNKTSGYGIYFKNDGGTESLFSTGFSVQLGVPVSAGTTAMTTSPYDALLVLTPAGTLATHTVQLPPNATARIGQVAIISSSQIITALTVSGAGSITGAPSGLAPYLSAIFVKTANDTWVCVDAAKETPAGAQAKADAKVADAIADGVTTIAPSQNAVFDALAALAAATQPVDADLTAIAALATAAYGRGLLTLADAAALRAAAAPAAATSSAVSFTLVAGHNVFTGSTAAQTGTLPAPTGTQRITFKNQSSVSITIASASGSQIYTTAAQANVTVLAGDSLHLEPDGTLWSSI